ncbi:cobalt-precorrin-6A reductase [Epibacterium ulvae]|uniref:cobalt-precorrin-6A reductase n=1 Tax=Epibacterium ulvae TaxID=1156985 RepID=UPI0024939D7B|nr:cobalt-precorrin-6A reductase [Epibacterium ulvae]
MEHILLLGGTTEASQMAACLAKAGRRAVFSYAGRTKRPVLQPLPMRQGGFGGVAGLVDYITSKKITHVIDATHPFAAQMSAHAVAACHETGARLCALQRPVWQAGPEDRWQPVADIAAAVAALPEQGARVFLAIGKQTLDPFVAKAHNFYLLRLVDPPVADLPLPYAQAVIARGPFDVDGDLALMRAHNITHVVAKNAGGRGAVAKLKAARNLKLPVILIERPQVPDRQIFDTVADVMEWLATDHVTERGV